MPELTGEAAIEEAKKRGYKGDTSDLELVRLSSSLGCAWAYFTNGYQECLACGDCDWERSEDEEDVDS